MTALFLYCAFCLTMTFAGSAICLNEEITEKDKEKAKEQIEQIKEQEKTEDTKVKIRF